MTSRSVADVHDPSTKLAKAGWRACPSQRAIEPVPAEPATASLGPSLLELEDDVAVALSAGAIDGAGASVRELAMVLWCAVHGLATLSLSAPHGAEELLEATQVALLQLILRPSSAAAHA